MKRFLLLLLLFASPAQAQLRSAVSLATDDFTRADANPIGGNWTTQNGIGAMRLVSNTLRPSDTTCNSDAGAYYNTITPGADQYAQMKVTVTGGISSPGYSGPFLMLRAATGAYTYYQITVNKTATKNVSVAKFVAGAFTGFDSSGGAWTRTWTDGDTLRAEIRTQGSSAIISVYHNGVFVGSVTDTSPIASGRVGAGSSSGSITVCTGDDWQGGNLRRPLALGSPMQ